MGWCTRCACFVFVSLACCVIWPVRALVLEDGVYKDVLVTFSTEVPAEDAEAIVNYMQETLKITSNVLKKAIGVSIGDVTFFIPLSWNVTDANSPTALLSRRLPDISVSSAPSNSAFGKHPLAVQYGGCGVSGLGIEVPDDFLRSEEDVAIKAKVLAKEWLKYRYGVFDEHGFQGDQRYPLYYSVPGTGNSAIQVSDCTNVPLKYQFKGPGNANCTPLVQENNGLPTEEDQCSVYPDEDSQKNVESSIMYLPTLPKVEHVCGTESHPHNSNSPNKQNALCNGKSIKEVLMTSTELNNVKIVEGNQKAADPVFNFVQESAPRIVVAHDTTSNIGDKRGETVKTSIRRFLYDLPPSSRCSFVRFSSTAEVILPLQQVPNSLEDRLSLDIKLRFAFDVPVDTACPQCAIGKALDILVQDDPNAPGSIVLIPSSNPTNDEQLLGRLKSSQVCLTVLGFKELSATEEGFANYLGATPCGSFIEIPDSEDLLEMYEAMHRALMEAIPKTGSPKHTVSVVTSYLRSGSDSEPFSIGPPSAKVTLWLMPTKDLYHDAILCKTTEGSRERAPTSVFEPTMLIALTFQSNVNELLTCSLKYTRDPVLMQARSTSLPGNHLDVTTWIEDTTTVGTPDQMPVIVYVKVHLGVYPVLKAEVKAVVTPPSGDVMTFNLHDNGIGDPDITLNDGIYSRYFTQFTAAGPYAVTISITDNERQAQAGMKGADSCCGSRVNVAERMDLGRFERSLKTEFQAVSGRPVLGYKPSRVSDFRVVSTSPGYVSLRWTAPGGEADQGKVARYAIKLFDRKIDAESNFDTQPSLQELNITDSISSYGETQTIEVKLDDGLPQKATYFIAAKAINDNELQSEVSNVATIFVSDQDLTTSTDDASSVTPDGDTDAKSGGMDKTVMIIIIVTVTVLVLIICIYIVVFFCVIKPKRKRERARKKENPAGTKTMTSVANNNNSSAELNDLRSIHSIPADVILNHHRNVQDAKMNKRPPPIFKSENLHRPQQITNGVNNEGFDHTSERLEDSSRSSSSESSECNLKEFPVKIYATPKSVKRVTVV